MVASGEPRTSMAWLSGWPLTLQLLGLSLLLLVALLREASVYWRRLGVPHLPPRLLFGNAAGLFFMRESFGALIEDVYRRLEGRPVGGFYLMTQPYLLLRDPEVIRRVDLSDETHFRSSCCGLWQGFHEALGCGGDGAAHAEVRRRVADIFGPERTRRNFCLLGECVERVMLRMRGHCEGAPGPVELRPHAVFAAFATDVIGRCAFGVECGAIDDPSSQFLRIGMEVSRPSRWAPLLACLRPLLQLPYLRALVPHCASAAEGHQLFRRLFRETVQYRERRGIRCEDAIQLLLHIKNGQLASHCVSPSQMGAAVDEALAYKLLGLFLAGFAMTSSVLSFCALELAADQAVQTRARLEVDAALRAHDGRLSYDALQRMPYLDAVLAETLRLYPPIGAVCREVVAPYRVPGTAATLQPGDRVCVAVAPLQRDAAHFPQPLQFQPERSLQPGGGGGDGHGCYLALGWGARPCVGRHFGLVEMKAVMAALLSRFELQPSLRSSGRPANPEGAGRDLWVRLTPRIWYADG